MASNVLITTRKLHKWLMAFIGVQFVIWSVTGAYMVFFDIDYIHGDSLVHNKQTYITPNELGYPLMQLHVDFPDASSFSIGMLADIPVYRFHASGRAYIVDASTGVLLSPLNESLALAVAQSEYTGTGQVRQITLIESNPPFELSPRHLPAWQVTFDDFGSPNLYVSADSGLIVSKRHAFWRLFDWMFRFHVMDYQDSEVDNTLLFWFALTGLLAGLTGAVLVYYRVVRRETTDSGKTA